MGPAMPLLSTRKYPADPHLCLRRAVIHNDFPVLLRALQRGGRDGRDGSGDWEGGHRSGCAFRGPEKTPPLPCFVGELQPKGTTIATILCYIDSELTRDGANNNTSYAVRTKNHHFCERTFEELHFWICAGIPGIALK